MADLIEMTLLNRRRFLKTSGICVGCSLVPFTGISDLPLISEVLNEPLASAEEIGPHEAMFYKKLQDREIECQLCPRKCQVGDKERGYCGARENRGGSYYTLVYGNPCSANIDPVEKKPFFHYMPGTLAFSIATAGCNLNCKFCQNWQISQFRPEQVKSLKMSPSDIVSTALQYECSTIAYTYSEPTVFYEYMKDCAITGKSKNIRSLLISAGYIESQPLQELLPYLAAVKIDLKSFSEKYYSDICNGELKPVLETLKTLKKSNIWFEIVYLMVPTLNDNPDEVKNMCQWIIDDLGPDVPIHFTRFHPEYLLTNLPSTPVESLETAYDIAKAKGINYPYVGNVYGHKGENTFCPKCDSLLISRQGFQVQIKSLVNGHCAKCGMAIPGVWA